MRVDSACLPRKMLNNLHIMSHAIPLRRFTRTNPCPICGGHDGLGRGRGVRCFGYYDSTGAYARCTREEYAGSLPQNRDGTYSHRLHGDCRCGQVHGDAPARRAMPAPPPPAPAGGPSSGSAPIFTLAAFLRQPLRRGHGRPALDLPRRRRATRSSASCASITAAPDGSTGQELPPLP